MTKKHIPIYLFLFTLIVRLLTAEYYLSGPSSIDASYYFSVARNLYLGRGLSDNFIWNYLYLPANITHPSFSYWMPLTSALEYLAFLALGISYKAAQLPSILLSSLLPLVTYYTGKSIFESERIALWGAIFTIFSTPLFIEWVNPDCYSIFALTGSLSLYLMVLGLKSGRVSYLIWASLFVGLSSLTRVDGSFLFLVLALTLFLFPSIHKEKLACIHRTSRKATILVILPFLLIMLPWYYRNYSLFGTLSPIGLKPIFLRRYSDLFYFGNPFLNLSGYLRWGLGNILASKFHFLSHNFINIARHLSFCFFPFALIGIYKQRREIKFLPVIAYTLFLYLSMSLFFPYPASGGSLSHSLSSLLPFLFCFAIYGLDLSIEYIVKKRSGWEKTRIKRDSLIVFLIIELLICWALLALVKPVYKNYTDTYSFFGKWAQAHTSKDAVLMSDDAATLYYYSQRRCIATPHHNWLVVYAAAKRYGAKILLLSRSFSDENIFSLPPPKQLANKISLIIDLENYKIYKINLNYERH